MNRSWICAAAFSLLAFGLTLGACPAGDNCKAVSHAALYCEEGVLYWVDTCGDFEDVSQHCECGCSADHQACEFPCGCVPNCAGKCCGNDGCGGQCPNSCGAGQTCNQASCTCEGSCQPVSCQDRGYACGTWPNGDGCGGTLSCGNCPSGEQCSASGQCIPLGCPNGLALCEGACVDTTEDARYCGGCNTTCQAGQVCINSQCQAAANCSQTPCVGMAYCDLASGQCMPGCLTDSQCPSNYEVCNTMTHDCECQPGMHRCTGVCYTDTDVDHCGVSCQVCQQDPFGDTSCTNGQCLTSCDDDYELCADACAPCPTTGANNFGCSGSACVATSCYNGYRLCADACASCPSGGVSSTGCSGSACVATACTNGYELCNGACDPCPTTGVTSTGCQGDQCVATACQTGYALCEGACAACPATDAIVLQTGCQGGQCVATACATGYYPRDGGCAAWVTEDLEYGSSIGWGNQLELGNDDYPQIAYCDGGNRHMKMGRIWDVDWIWDLEIVDSADQTGIMPSLAIDAQNQPHVVYYDLNNNRLKYARYNSTTGLWTIEVVVSAGGSFVNSSMDLDSTGQPHVCYFDASDEAFYYIKRTASGWGNRILIEATGWIYNTDVPCSLAVGSNNQPRVLYRQWDDNYNNWLKLATYTGSTWQMETLINQEPIVLTRSLQLGAADDPHVLYCNVSSNRLVYGHKQGNSWTYSTVAQDVYMGEYTAAFQLRLDSAEQPHAIWKDYGAYYGQKVGNSWFTFTLTEDSVNDISFDLDANDRPHFSLDTGYTYTTLQYWH